jgi:hypothetical protein
MQKLFNFLMVGLTFAVLNVATVAADVPLMDTSAAPIGEGGEAGGPAATDSGVMINDGGHGANSGAENYAKSTEGDPYCVKLYTEGKIESVPLCVWKNEAWVLLKPEY